MNRQQAPAAKKEDGEGHEVLQYERSRLAQLTIGHRDHAIRERQETRPISLPDGIRPPAPHLTHMQQGRCRSTHIDSPAANARRLGQMHPRREQGVLVTEYLEVDGLGHEPSKRCAVAG